MFLCYLAGLGKYALSLFTVVVACFGISSLALAGEIPVTAGAAILGKGYDSKAQEYRGDCIPFNATDPQDVSQAGASSSSLQFSRSLTASELQSSLGFDTSARARFGVVTVSLAAQFAKDSLADDYSESTTYQAVYNFKNTYLNQNKLTNFANRVLGSGAFAASQFFATCGDEYVKQVKRGAMFLFSVKLAFATREDKQRFSSQFSLQGPLAGLTANVDTASRQFGKSASIQISAYQLGGRIDRLSTIFSRGTTQNSSESVHALLRCSMADLKPCLEVISQALDYATSSTNPDAFAQQLEEPSDPTKRGGPADLAYLTEPWSNLAIFVEPHSVSAAIQGLRQELVSILDKQLILRARLDTLVQKAFRLSPTQATLLNRYSSIVNANLSDIVTAATVCYTDDEKCPIAVSTLSRVMAQRAIDESFDPAKLDISPETFAQWCDFVGIGISGPPPTPALRKSRNTVEALIAYAKSVSVAGMDDTTWSHLADPCKYAEDLLAQLPQIGFDGKDIRDLRPLNAFSSLKTLVVKNANIEDDDLAISGLSRLSNLLTLDLSGNAIQDVLPLDGLRNVRVIDVSNNHITDVSPLAHLPHLTVLKLGGNPLQSKTCPIIRPDGACFF